MVLVSELPNLPSWPTIAPSDPTSLHHHTIAITVRKQIPQAPPSPNSYGYCHFGFSLIKSYEVPLGGRERECVGGSVQGRSGSYWAG